MAARNREQVRRRVSQHRKRKAARERAEQVAVASGRNIGSSEDVQNLQLNKYSARVSGDPRSVSPHINTPAPLHSDHMESSKVQNKPSLNACSNCGKRMMPTPSHNSAIMSLCTACRLAPPPDAVDTSSLDRTGTSSIQPPVNADSSPPVTAWPFGPVKRRHAVKTTQSTVRPVPCGPLPSAPRKSPVSNAGLDCTYEAAEGVPYSSVEDHKDRVSGYQHEAVIGPPIAGKTLDVFESATRDEPPSDQLPGKADPNAWVQAVGTQLRSRSSSLSSDNSTLALKKQRPRARDSFVPEPENQEPGYLAHKGLIQAALLAAPSNRLQVREVREWIANKYPEKYDANNMAWRNSLAVYLSYGAKSGWILKQPREPGDPGQGGWWALKDAGSYRKSSSDHCNPETLDRALERGESSATGVKSARTGNDRIKEQTPALGTPAGKASCVKNVDTSEYRNSAVRKIAGPKSDADAVSPALAFVTDELLRLSHTAKDVAPWEFDEMRGVSPLRRAGSRPTEFNPAVDTSSGPALDEARSPTQSDVGMDKSEYGNSRDSATNPKIGLPCREASSTGDVERLQVAVPPDVLQQPSTITSASFLKDSHSLFKPLQLPHETMQVCTVEQLYALNSDLDAGVRFGLESKLEEIRRRPSRKARFGKNKPVRRDRESAVVSAKNLNLEVGHTPAPELTDDGRTITHYTNIYDLLGIPENVIPTLYNGHLAFRDGNLINGLLGRSKTLLKLPPHRAAF
ncbi:hypothetical protein LTR50_006950 [Elasticomyces elasticus]|nr:hypothetical protein LTR50_006950 [Elasticomyces elasticus]